MSRWGKTGTIARMMGAFVFAHFCQQTNQRSRIYLVLKSLRKIRTEGSFIDGHLAEQLAPALLTALTVDLVLVHTLFSEYSANVFWEFVVFTVTYRSLAESGYGTRWHSPIRSSISSQEKYFSFQSLIYLPQRSQI
jgi:hypothetical protein